MSEPTDSRCPACGAELPTPAPPACPACGNRLQEGADTGAATHAPWLVSALVQAGAAGMSFVTLFLICGATVVGSNYTDDISVLRTCQLITLAQVAALLGWLAMTEWAGEWRPWRRRSAVALATLLHVAAAYFVWHWGYWSW